MKLKYYTVVQKQSFRNFRKDEKIDIKGMSKGSTNDSKIELWARMGSHFCDFGRLFEGSDFKWIFDQPKGWQQIAKIVITAANGERDRCLHDFEGGVGGGG